MQTQNLAAAPGAARAFDVALPQGQLFAQISCQFRDLSAIVHLDRTQAVFTSHKRAAQSTPSMNKWSRGCRALRSPYLRFALSASLPLAQRKLKKSYMSTSRPLRSSRPIPANTSKFSGRVTVGSQPRPALFSTGAPWRISVPLTMEGAAC